MIAPSFHVCQELFSRPSRTISPLPGGTSPAASTGTAAGIRKAIPQTPPPHPVTYPRASLFLSPPRFEFPPARLGTHPRDGSPYSRKIFMPLKSNIAFCEYERDGFPYVFGSRRPLVAVRSIFRSRDRHLEVERLPAQKFFRLPRWTLLRYPEFLSRE